MKKNEKKTLEISINNLMVLCEIVDEYETFKPRLEHFLNGKNNRTAIYDLFCVSAYKMFAINRNIKKFYVENKSVIDKINKYSNVGDFITSAYDLDGNLRNYACFDEFYNYLKENKEHLDQIKAVVTKLRNLGISKLELDENIDFTNETYSINKKFNYKVIILDNMQAIPNYQQDVIKYKTNGSNYALKFNVDYSEISSSNSRAVVNSLFFDASKLPDEVSIELVTNLKGHQESANEALRNAVDITIGLDDLEKEYIKFNRIINRLDRVSNKQEMQAVLESIKLEIAKLRDMSLNYNQRIVDSHDDITMEQIDEEKKLKLERIYWSKIDLC